MPLSLECTIPYNKLSNTRIGKIKKKQIGFGSSGLIARKEQGHVRKPPPIKEAIEESETYDKLLLEYRKVGV